MFSMHRATAPILPGVLVSTRTTLTLSRGEGESIELRCPVKKNDEGQFSGEHHVACIIPYEGTALKNNLGHYSRIFLAGREKKDAQCVHSVNRPGRPMIASSGLMVPHVSGVMRLVHHGALSACRAIRSVRSAFCIPVDNLLKD